MALTDQYGQNVPYSTMTDQANAQTLGQNLVENIVPRTIMRFPSANVRGATIKKPVEGMASWLEDARRLEIYQNGAWMPYSTDPSWGTYNPVWGGLTAMGGSVSYGRVSKEGRRVEAVATLTAGTGSTLGTGNITVSLPTPANGSVPSGFAWQGTGVFYQNDGTAWRLLAPIIDRAASDAIVFAVRPTDNGLVRPGVLDYSWAPGSVIRVQFTYESAA